MGLLQRFADAWDDKAKRAKILFWFWVVSTGFLFLGLGIIFVKLFLEKTR